MKKYDSMLPLDVSTSASLETLPCCLACGGHSFETVQRTRAMMHPSEESFNFDECQDCGLVQLNPRVRASELMHYYTDYYLPYRGEHAWGKYATLVKNSQIKMDRQRVKRVQQFVPLNSSTKLVDIGCGKPTFLEQAQRLTGCHALGLDFNDSGWRDEPQRFAALQLQVGEVGNLMLDTADVFTMWHYLEHDYAPMDTLRQLRQYAQADTHLIVEVPNYDSDSRRRFGTNWAGWHSPRHTALYTPKSMTVLLERSGWQVKQTLSYGTLDPYNLYWMSRMEQRGIDWSQDMEQEFWGYVRGMVAFLPKRWLGSSLGVMTAIATPRK